MKRNRLARRPLLLLLSLLMLLGIFSTASAEESTNLLQNPGFEEIGADGLPVGWKNGCVPELGGRDLLYRIRQRHVGRAQRSD